MSARYAYPRALDELRGHRLAVVEASAGTGKTFLIEHRVVDLVLGGAAIDDILVVTFTEKATAELRARIRALLARVRRCDDEAEAGAPAWTLDAAARERLDAALLAFDRAPIHTIHGFCHRVLTENAFAGRRLLDQTQVADEIAFGDAFRGALREELARDEAELPYLAAWLRRGRSVDDLERLLFRCAAQPGELAPPFDAERLRAALGRAVAELPRVADEGHAAASLAAAGLAKNTANAAARRLAALRGVVDAWAEHGDAARFLAEIELTDRDFGSGSMFDYLADKLAAVDNLGEVVAAIAALAGACVPLEAAVAQRFLPRVVARTRTDKDRRGLFDFHDMLRLVWEGLDGPDGAALAARLRARYRHALIDEFQDTDPLQWQIFRRLYVEGDGSLCLIGDPKQAIYSFRGADVDTYVGAASEVAAAGGAAVYLEDNYRSTAAVVRAYNLLFEERLDRYFTGDIGYEHPVRPAAGVTAEQDGAPATPVRVLHVVPGAGTKKLTADAVRAALLDRIAGEIGALLGDHPLELVTDDGRQRIGAGDIFVLTRTTAESNDVAARLRRAGIPSAIYKQEGLFQTREAHEILDLLAGIAEPADRAARFRALATRFFDVRLGDLPAASELPDGHPLLGRLYGWKKRADRLAYEELFPAILAESGFTDRELVLAGSERALTNVLHIFELLLEDVMRSRCELHELVRRLQRWMTTTGEDDPGDRNIQRLESDRDAVQIMTIHRAKGLEAAAVFVYGGLGRAPLGDVAVYHEDGARRVAIGRPRGAKDAVAREVEREDQRLLYVAVTRAVARLYLPYLDRGAYRVAGAYAAVNRRLEGIVRCAGGEDAPDVASLFEVERIPATRPERAAAAAATADLAGWTPPAELLAISSAVTDYDDLRRTRRGPVVTSYTQMKRASDAVADDAIAAAGVGEDELPGGTAAGIFLHDVLEHVDLGAVAAAPDFETWAADPDVRSLFENAMARNLPPPGGGSAGVGGPQDPPYLASSQRIVWNTLTAPIPLGDHPADPIPLSATARHAREVEFLYPLPGPESRGFVKGFIDLVVEHEGRLYAVDYKSDVLADYTADAIAHHVAAHYQLQADLYALALARMAGDEDRFGGLVYTFVRASGGDGVWAHRPGAGERAAVAARLAAAEVSP